MKTEVRNMLYRRRPLGVAVATLTALACLPTTAFAQAAAELEEITVTGSRIRMTNGMEAPTPVTSVTVEELFQQEPGSTISQQLDGLPQFFNNGSPQRGDGGNPSVGSGGPGALNIRNLNSASTGAGISRTLTLLDGARVVPTDKRGTVNVDMFPTALMRSVDVVTGGASAAYGADALGGVVNFVLDREFEGLKVSAGTGMHEYDRTGKQYELSVAGGKSFLDERLHLIGSVEGRQIDEIQPDQERWDSLQDMWGYVTNPAWSAAGCRVNVYCAAGPQRLTLPNVTTLDTAPTGLIRGTNSPLDWMKFTRDGTALEPFVRGPISALPGGTGSTSTTSGSPETAIDYATSALGPTGMEVVSRSSLFGAQYDLTSNLNVFTTIIVGRTESNDTSNNANFSMANTFAPIIARDNAYLPASVGALMDANRVTQFALNKSSQQFDGHPELGSTRKGRNVFTQWQYNIGIDWDFTDTWNLRASWQQGESKRNSQAYNLLQVDRMALGLDAVVDPTTGQIVCRVNLPQYRPTLEQLRASVAGRISNVPLNPYIPAGVPGNTQPLPYPVEPAAITECVPYNIFGSGNMGQAAIDYVGTDRFNIGYVDQDFAEALVTGELHEGWGAGAIGFAGGVTWRDQQFITYATPLDVDLLGPAVNVPALGIRGIGAGFGTSTALNLFSGIPKIGGQTDVWEWFTEVSVPLWEFNDNQRIDTDFAFRRSTYDRSGAIDSWKVGTNIQLYSDLRLRMTKSRDVREPSFAELFDAQGSGETIQDPMPGKGSYLSNTIRGGNPNLSPEYADTKTVGFVYQPSFTPLLEGLSMSVDWYDVDIKDAVARLTAQRIINECFTTNSPALCGLITRDAVTGNVVQTLDVFLNVAAARTRGVDVEVSWRKEIEGFFADQNEYFSLRWLTGRTFERSDTAPASTPLDRSGTLGMPDLTTNLTGSYGVGAWSFQLQAQFVDQVLRNAMWVEGIQVDDNNVASMTWLNGRIGYQGETGGGSTWSVGLNVQNILDREPPIFGWTNNTYDQYGRRYNLNVNYNF